MARKPELYDLHVELNKHDDYVKKFLRYAKGIGTVGGITRLALKEFMKNLESERGSVITKRKK